MNDSRNLKSRYIMMEVINKMNNCNTLICQCCLSSDRILRPLMDYEPIFLKIMEIKPITSQYLVCWECLAILHKIMIFRDQVRKAQTMLRRNPKQIIFSSLSKLKIHIFNTISYTVKLEFESSVNEGIVKNEPIGKDDSLPEDKLKDMHSLRVTDMPLEDYVKQDDSRTETKDNTDNRGIFEYDTAAFDADDDKIEIKTEENSDIENFDFEKYTKRNKVSKDKSQKGKPLKVNYKISFSTNKNITKVPIDSETWKFYMEKDKNSEWFKNIKYKCVRCLMVFQNILRLRSHIRRCHSEGLNYICDLCSCGFEVKSPLITHLKYHSFLHECRVCLFKTCLAVGIQDHFEKNHSKAFHCSKCDMSFRRRKDFYEHYNASHRKFICDYCGKVCLAKSVIRKHIWHHHTTHTCNTCNKSFILYRNLRDHRARYHKNQEKVYCVECNTYYSNTNAYKRHLATSKRHETQNRESHPLVQCPDCEKQYTRRTFMLNHYRHVHLNTGHRCDLCDKRFLTATRLKDHKRSFHEGIPRPKNKLCTICGRGFNCNKTLTNHIMTHTGERPHACELCPARFTQKYSLTVHLKSVHDKGNG